MKSQFLIPSINNELQFLISSVFIDVVHLLFMKEKKEIKEIQFWSSKRKRRILILA